MDLALFCYKARKNYIFPYDFSVTKERKISFLNNIKKTVWEYLLHMFCSARGLLKYKDSKIIKILFNNYSEGLDPCEHNIYSKFYTSDNDGMHALIN